MRDLHRTVALVIFALSLSPVDSIAQDDKARIDSVVGAYLQDFLMPRLTSTEGRDSVCDQFLDGPDLTSALLDSLAKVNISSGDYAEGVRINLKHQNCTINNCIQVSDDETFISLELRSRFWSDTGEIGRGIELLGRPRDFFYLVFTLRLSDHHISLPEFVVTGYDGLNYHRIHPGSPLLWSLHNQSSFGGGYSSVILRITNPNSEDPVVLEEEVFAQGRDYERQADVDRMLHFEFLGDTLRFTGVQVIGGSDSTIRQTIILK